MIIVDTALKAREEQGKPIRVGLIGAGFMGQGLTKVRNYGAYFGRHNPEAYAA